MKKFKFNNLRFNEKGAKKVLGDLEAQIMECLWKSESLSIAQIKGLLEKDLAFNTVMTVLHRLVDKKYVKREKEGRTSLYSATQERDVFMEGVSRHLFNELFGKNAVVGVSHFADLADSVDKETLKKLKKGIDDALSKK